MIEIDLTSNLEYNTPARVGKSDWFTIPEFADAIRKVYNQQQIYYYVKKDAENSLNSKVRMTFFQYRWYIYKEDKAKFITALKKFNRRLGDNSQYERKNKENGKN